MSYILDALRRAQAERERGQVPGLHAQPGLAGVHRARPTAAGAADQALRTRRWALVGAGVLVALLLALLLWWAQRGVAVAPGAALPPLPAPPPSVAARQVVPAPGPSTEPAPLVVVSAPAVQVPPAKPAAKPAAAAAAAATTSAPASTAPPAAPSAVPEPPAQPTSPAATALPPALTAEQRRDWPPLAMGGSVWSDTPSARFVILGGQVVREGETTADGVQVERITPKAVVLRWRDQRASLAF